ncbi:MAG: phosphate signaling complex protein PhoU [Candidatus Competibacteraceae bacterium]
MAFTNSQHTVRRFDAEINGLVNQVLEMGRAAEMQVTRAVEALRMGDGETAQAVVAGDDTINHLDLDIQQGCLRLLSRRQPMSTDLRLVMSLNKAISDLERIGDEAKTIAKKALAIKRRGNGLQSGITADISRLAEIVLQRFQAAQQILAQLNTEQAWQIVHQNENAVDEAFGNSLRALSVYVLDNGPAVATVIDIVLALKALKRVADHAENLAEYVIYVVEGQDVRHAI